MVISSNLKRIIANRGVHRISAGGGGDFLGTTNFENRNKNITREARTIPRSIVQKKLLAPPCANFALIIVPNIQLSKMKKGEHF